MAQKNFQHLPAEIVAAIMSYTDWVTLLNFRVLNKHTKVIFNSDFFLLLLKQLMPKFVEPGKIVESDFWREKLVRIPGIPAKVSPPRGFYNYMTSTFSPYMKQMLLFIEDLLNGNSHNYVYFWLKMVPTEHFHTQDLKKIWTDRGYDSNLFQRLENILIERLAPYGDPLFTNDFDETRDYICSTRMDFAISLPLLLGLPEIAEKNAEYLKKERRLKDLIVHVELLRYCKRMNMSRFDLFTTSELIEKFGTEKLRKILISQE